MHLALSILLATTLAAPASHGDTFEIFIDGSPSGTETFTRTEGEDGVTLSGAVSLKLPEGQVAKLTQDSKLARDGHPVSYALDVDAPGQQVTVTAKLVAAGYAMSITAKGARAPLQSKESAVAAPVFLLDNNFASHLDALTRRLLDLGVGDERAIAALVPQVLQAIPATIKRGPDGKATQDGVPIATRSYRLTMANVGTELLARETDGALLQAEIPLQDALLKRRGFDRSAGRSRGVPQDGSDPRERAAEVKGEAAALRGTLLLPKSDTPAPGIVFLSGSGPNDKDETIGPNKPFADLARGLGDRGMASLRFDKRTFGMKDQKKLAGVRLKEEYYEDAKAAISLLSGTPGVDPKRIFVVGHSEGAMVAPIVAGASPGTRGVVMMAPGVRPIDAMLIDQMERGAKVMGRSAEEIAEQTELLKATFAAIRDPKRKDTPPFMGAPATYWREVLALDVPKLVRESTLPILVLQGDKDVQVRKDLDFELLKARAGEAGGRVTYRSFADLNHLFMKIEHESTGAEYGFPGHVDPAVTAAIADWILSH